MLHVTGVEAWLTPPASFLKLLFMRLMPHTSVIPLAALYYHPVEKMSSWSEEPNVQLSLQKRQSAARIDLWWANL